MIRYLTSNVTLDIIEYCQLMRNLLNADYQCRVHSTSSASQEHDVAGCITSHGCVNGISDYHDFVPPTLNMVAHLLLLPQ